MEDNGYPIETTIYEAATVDLDFIKNELARGQDVELRVPGHVLVIVGIARQANGKYNIHVAHDINQGHTGGEVVQILEYDPSLGYLPRDGVYYKDMTDSKIIVECPKKDTPFPPATPTGPIKVLVNEEATYLTSTIDPEEDPLYYYCDWGDGTISDWLGPYESGQSASGSHTWTSEGTYSIKVKARDEYGHESEWSDSLPISVPRSKILELPILKFLQRVLFVFPMLQKIIDLQSF